jgi:hypothetical protein
MVTRRNAIATTQNSEIERQARRLALMRQVAALEEAAATYDAMHRRRMHSLNNHMQTARLTLAELDHDDGVGTDEQSNDDARVSAAPIPRKTSS